MSATTPPKGRPTPKQKDQVAKRRGKMPALVLPLRATKLSASPTYLGQRKRSNKLRKVKVSGRKTR